MKKIGEIMLDTGILLLGDLINLKKIKQSSHAAERVFLHSVTQKKYTQGVDFQKYTDILWDGKTVNELIQSNELTSASAISETELSSENIINGLESSSGFKMINFSNGTSGKAIAILSKEGPCPVYVETDEKGISRLVIEFRP